MADKLHCASNSGDMGFKKKQKASAIIGDMHRRYRVTMSRRGDFESITQNQNESELRKNAALRMRIELDQYSHIQCAKAFAFPKHLEQDEPFREQRSDGSQFFEQLQEELVRSGSRTKVSFVEREPRSVESGVSSIHIDITGDVKKFYPTESMRMQVVDVGGAVFTKMRRRMQPFMTSERYKYIVDLHIHVDEIRMRPPQVFCEKRVHEDFPDRAVEASDISEGQTNEIQVDGNSHVANTGPGERISPAANTGVRPLKLEAMMDVEEGAGNDIREKMDQVKDLSEGQSECGTKTVLSENWSTLMSVPSNHTFLTYLHAVFAARSAVHLLEERSGVLCDLSTEDNQETDLGCSVFLHGACIAVSKGTRTVRLHSLRFSRRGEAVFITGPEDPNDERLAATDAQGGVDVYDTSCCWKVSPKGFERHPPGDSRHGLSQTRFVNSLCTVTGPSLSSRKLPKSRWKVLLVSESEDSPLITLLSESLQRFEVFHKISEKYLEISALRRAIAELSIPTEDLILLHSLAGDSVCPSTRHVSQKRYLQAYFLWRSNLPPDSRALFRREFISYPVSSESETGKALETLLACAFLCVSENSEYVRMRRLRGLEREKDWSHSIRKMLAMNPNIKEPSMFMPEAEDLELQMRRAFWELRYWMQANQSDCNKHTTGGLSEEWGFKKHGYPLLERQKDVEWRDGIIKKSLRVCKCTSGCKTKRYGCRNRDIPSPCLFCKCTNCENVGEGPNCDVQNTGCPGEKQGMMTDRPYQRLNVQSERVLPEGCGIETEGFTRVVAAPFRDSTREGHKDKEETESDSDGSVRTENGADSESESDSLLGDGTGLPHDISDEV